MDDGWKQLFGNGYWKVSDLIAAREGRDTNGDGDVPDYGSQVRVPPLRLAPGQEMDMDIPLSKR